jgi:hypothetical protein
MIALVLVLGLDFLITVFEFFFEDQLFLLEFMEITSDIYAAPFWFTGIIIVTGFLTWVCVAMVFWPLHKIISMRAISFAEVGRNLKNSAYAGIGFWAGSTFLFTLFPLFYYVMWDPAAESENAFVPLGFETIFLVMSLTFLTIGKTLERADAIEEENNQFL